MRVPCGSEQFLTELDTDTGIDGADDSISEGNFSLGIE